MSAQHSSGFLNLVNQVRAQIKEIDIETMLEMKEQDQAFVLIDVREQNEWAAGHIPDATYLGKGIIERDIESQFPDKATKLVLYCGGGYRSALAADNLQKMGYTNVISMDGGYRRWLSLGHRVEVDV
ncbi:rhodanese-like domain-containing protein [Catenovulum maritimum]|uniref:Sulfurtransferase n=1 Tax=Catenovulum maritimum TaxID=1513271 RepID=A0A0J8H1F3_9ALTE|nr:rhodanese-like domain-containing protein [Catenovulum maritimum]KMT66853.1 sulfurtransferase [Catenovulum maritimum]